ncbi:MAG: adenosine deaminase [archaeon]
METPQWLIDMPKTDLHCHLAGSTRITSLLELADQYGVALPAKNEEELRKLVVYKNKQDKSLVRYLEGIAICESVFVKPDAFSRAAYEICQDAHAENVNVLELRFGPTNYEKESLRLYAIMEATLDGIARAKRDFGMYAGVIVCGIRNDLEATKRAVELAINYQERGAIGFDLAGPEKGNRPELFEQIIMPVLRNFLPVTTHAGEADDVASIAQAIIYLNARRIGHGISLRESTKLFDFINTQRIPIETCITSNIDTGAVASLDTHPVRTYYNRGLRLAICTDNRTISDTTVTKEYMQLIEHLGFTQKMIYDIAKKGIKSAFLHIDDCIKLLDEFDHYAGNKLINGD